MSREERKLLKDIEIGFYDFIFIKKNMNSFNVRIFQKEYDEINQIQNFIKKNFTKLELIMKIFDEFFYQHRDIDLTFRGVDIEEDDLNDFSNEFKSFLNEFLEEDDE